MIYHMPKQAIKHKTKNAQHHSNKESALLNNELGIEKVPKIFSSK